MDLLSNPRLIELLQQADTALTMLSEADRSAREDFEDALRGIYVDMGKLVHGIHRTRKVPAPSWSTTETEQIDDDDEPIQYTQEVPLEDDPSEDWQTDEVSVSTLPSEDAVVSARGFRLGPVVTPRGRQPPWLPQLHDLLDLLPFPGDLTEPTELAVEATRVQWATSGTSENWKPYPQSIQVALTGLLASRARHLQEVLNVEVGPRLALFRLRRHQVQARLPAVVGLFGERSPELGSWRSDAEHWYETLFSSIASLEGATLR